MIDSRLIKTSELIIYSYKQEFQYPLIDKVCPSHSLLLNIHESLYTSEYCILAVNNNEIPTFTYMNLSAQKLWEVSLNQALKMQGKQTAQKKDQKEREKLLNQVKKKGKTNSYSGIRISQKGKRFFIKKASIWNIINKQGVFEGQAACFNQFEYLP